MIGDWFRVSGCVFILDKVIVLYVNGCSFGGIMGRDEILERLESFCSGDVQSDEIDFELTAYRDKIGAFKRAIEVAGAKVVQSSDMDVDIIIKSPLGVCENGAVWVDETLLNSRSDIVLPESIGIIVDSKDLVNNMHEAYQKISLNGIGYGVFLSGPSKTADIEQSLVIGAHGCIEMRVFVKE